MRVLHLLAYSPPFRGGLVGQLLGLGAALRDRGGRLYLAFPRHRPWHAELAEVATVWILPEIWHPHRMDLRRRVARLCHHHDIEILHLHYAFDLALALYRPLRAWPWPVVYHWRNPPRILLPRSGAGAERPGLSLASGAPWAVRRHLGRWAARLGERVIRYHIAVSGEIRDLLIAHGWTASGKVIRLPNPLGIAPPPRLHREPAARSARAARTISETAAPALQRARDATAARTGPAPAAELVVGSVANFLPQKDHPTLLRAFQQLLTRYPGSRLLLAGDGPLRGAAVALSEELGIRRRVEFLGYVDPRKSVYSRCDLFAHATHYEGQGMVLLEAMAHGLPVVATDLPSIRETITQEDTGLLVPGSDPRSLAAALARLAGAPALRQRLGSAARVRVARAYRVEDWAREVIGLYESLTGEVAHP